MPSSFRYPPRAMREPVNHFFAELDRLAGPLPLALLKDWLRRTAITADDLADFLVFRPGRYVRNLVHTGPGYQALALCWRNGQWSPIHNHRGSACGVKVLRGTATETAFVRAPNGMIVPTASRNLAAGSVCGSFDEDIHQVSNLQAGGADLVTLHLYSPPLLRMDVFSLDTPAVDEWDDPVNDDFLLGAGI